MNEENAVAISPRAELSVNADGSSLEMYNTQLSMIKKFIQGQLKQDTDYGVIPGTNKPTLYKPGAEKLAKLFNLGVSKIESVDNVDFDKNIAYIRRTVYLENLATGRTIAVCEGSCNSQEKKYKERKKYVDKKMVGMEPTPIGDVLNTLNKMAIKRAYVGAVIMAVGASDFFTQDLEDQRDYHQEDETDYNSMRLEDLSELTVPFGKRIGEKFKDVESDWLNSFVSWLGSQPKKTASAETFIKQANAYLNKMGQNA